MIKRIAQRLRMSMIPCCVEALQGASGFMRHDILTNEYCRFAGLTHGVKSQEFNSGLECGIMSTREGEEECRFRCFSMNPST